MLHARQVRLLQKKYCVARAVLHVRMPQAMRQLGEEAVTQVRTPQGDVQHVVDVDVDDMPAREKLTSVHSPGIKVSCMHSCFTHDLLHMQHSAC